MRFALFVAAALCGMLGVGCKGDPFRPDAAAEVPLDGPPKPPWFQPSKGEAKNWDIQLGNYNLAPQRDMAVVNIWDVVPEARMITYDTGAPVTVPAGLQAGAIAALHAKSTKVMCHVGTGAIRLSDPDASKFAGYETTPPNDPVPPVANSVIGWSVTAADANERFVDYRNADAQKILLKRVQLAKDIGCDGIAAYRNDLAAFEAKVGFSMVAAADDLTWIKAVVKASHDLMISVGGRGVLVGNIGEVKLEYDWLLVERCGELDDCDTFQPFIAAFRSVFALEYTTTLGGSTNTTDILCPRWADVQVDGILKTALDGTAPTPCP
jgi:Glycoside-hydrolase family GH114